MLCRRFLEGILLWNLSGGGVLRRVLRRGSQQGGFRRSQKAEARLSESTTPLACALYRWAKSHNSYGRSASESCRHDLNH